MNRNTFTRLGRVAAGLAAVSLVASASAASADDYRRHRGDHHRDRGDTAEAAIVAGVIGLALGAALASGDNGPRYDRDYDRSYSRPAYGYGYGYAPPPPRYGYGYGYDRGPRPSDCWTVRDYDRRSGAVYERTVCR